MAAISAESDKGASDWPPRGRDQERDEDGRDDRHAVLSVEPREQAVQAVYEADLLGSDEIPADAVPSSRGLRLARGVVASRVDLDRSIDAVSEHWRIDRMPAVDRAILRVALHELRHETNTPTAVILSEAVRIAKVFSTEKSGIFVNGILSTLAQQERTQDRKPKRG